MFNEQQNVMAYWEPVHGKDGTTGVGCLFTKPIQQILLTPDHLLTIAQIRNEEPLLYYSGAVWDKAGQMTSANLWFNYLQLRQLTLAKPLKVLFR